MNKNNILILFVCIFITYIPVSAVADDARLGGNRYTYRVPETLADGWQVSDLRRSKADAGRISSGVEDILNGKIQDMRSLLVVKGGKIVLEEYFNGQKPGDKQELYSVSKSVFSAVFGIAQDHGFLSANDKLYDYYPEYRSKPGWDGQKEKITIGMLLSMTSGFCTNEFTTGSPPPSCAPSLGLSHGWLDYYLSMPLVHIPGEAWDYNGASLIILSDLISKKSKMDFQEFTDKYLFGPLGIKGTAWSKGPGGVYKVEALLYMTSREMAKFGLLYLNGGSFGDKQIVSKKWVEESTAPKAPKASAWGQDYGYLWYSGHMKYGGHVIKIFCASGYAGQNIIVAPEADIVCVMTANSGNKDIYQLELLLFLNKILAAFGKSPAGGE